MFVPPFIFADDRRIGGPAQEGSPAFEPALVIL
jgi:hypothetical protein